MVDRKGENIIFLLCLPRSGSSLTTTILQNHSNIFAAQEMWLLMSLHDLQNTKVTTHGGGAIINRFYQNILPKEVYYEACRSFATQVYQGLLEQYGGSLILDKSPRYYYLLEFLDALFPLSKRIWLKRNPLAVVASYKKLHLSREGKFNLEEGLISSTFNHRMADITLGLFRYASYFRERNPYSYYLTYEKLVRTPNEEIEGLCSFLGLTYEEGIETYGRYLDTPKSNLFTSMGVGDPNVFNHSKPHQQSLNLWKEILSKKEIETYCRILGSSIFHELGYGNEIEEAEKWTGIKFQCAPDYELLKLRENQLKNLTKTQWESNYQMNYGVKSPKMHRDHLVLNPLINSNQTLQYESKQMKATIHSLEKRLEDSFHQREKLNAELLSLRKKVDSLKSFIPFKNQINSIFQTYVSNNGRNK